MRFTIRNFIAYVNSPKSDLFLSYPFSSLSAYSLFISVLLGNFFNLILIQFIIKYLFRNAKVSRFVHFSNFGCFICHVFRRFRSTRNLLWHLEINFLCQLWLIRACLQTNHFWKKSSFNLKTQRWSIPDLQDGSQPIHCLHSRGIQSNLFGRNDLIFMDRRWSSRFTRYSKHRYWLDYKR